MIFRIILLRSIQILTFLLLSAVLVLLLLVGTTTGSRFTVDQLLAVLNKQENIRISVEQVKGTLLSGLSFSELTLDLDGETDIAGSIDQLDMSWNIAMLWNKVFNVTEFAAETVYLSLSSETETEPVNIDLSVLVKPLFGQDYSFLLDKGQISELSLVNNGAETVITVPLISVHSRSESFTLSSLEMTYADIKLNAKNWRLQQDLSLSGQLLWGLSLANADYEGDLTVDGSLLAIELAHHLLSPISVESTGVIRPFPDNSSKLNFSLEHTIGDLGNFLALPSWLTDLSADLQTEGDLDNFTYESIVQLALADQNTIELKLSGRQENLNLQGEWSLSEDKLFELPAQISLNQPRSNGEYQLYFDQGLQGQVLFSDFNAQVNDVALNAKGSLQFVDSALGQIAFDITQNENLLTLQGSVGDEIDLALTADFPLISSLLPNLQGALTAKGQLSGRTIEPNLIASIQANSLRDDELDVSLSELNVEFSRQDEELMVKAELRNLVQADTALIVDGTIDASGLLTNHQYSVEIFSDFGKALITGSGQWQSEQWLSDITRADTSSDYGEWMLDQTSAHVEFNLNQQQVSLSYQCWAHSDLQLCLEGNGSVTGKKALQVDLHKLPLAWLEKDSSMALSRPQALYQMQEARQLYIPENTRLDGLLDVSASITQENPEQDWQLLLAIEPGQLMLSLLSETKTLNTTGVEASSSQEKKFNVNYSAISLQRLNQEWFARGDLDLIEQSDLGLPLIGSISTEFGLLANSEMNGNIVFALPSIAGLEPLIAQLKEVEGSLNGEVNVSGTLSQPIINSQMDLQETKFSIPQYGINVVDMSLNLKTDLNNEMGLSATLYSGEGKLEADAVIQTPFKGSRSAQLNLKGDNFQILNLANRHVTISPNLSINASHEALIVNGDVLLPVFSLVIEDEIEVSDRITESRDAYIVEIDASNSAQSKTLFQQTPIEGRVNLILGEEILFKGYGLEAELAGDIVLEKSQNRPVLGYGELKIPKASYTLYRQTLTSQNGQVLFLGNPMNPVIDVSAVREVADTTVGMHLSGTVNNIQGDLFSIPALPENEILAMLITGKSFNNIDNNDGSNMIAAIANLGIEKGQGLTNIVQNKLGLDTMEISAGREINDSSLGLGKYLSPELFVRYEVGLFDRESVLSLNYLLTQNIKLEVESGISQSIGVTYSIEK